MSYIQLQQREERRKREEKAALMRAAKASYSGGPKELSQAERDELEAKRVEEARKRLLSDQDDRKELTQARYP